MLSKNGKIRRNTQAYLDNTKQNFQNYTSNIMYHSRTHAHARSGREGSHQCLGGGSDPRHTDATQGTRVTLLRGACGSMGSDK